MGIVFTIMLISIRQGATSIFIKPSDAITYALSNEYLIFVALNLPLMGLFQNLQGVFNGSGHTMYSLIITASRLWVIRLPIIWYAANYLDLGHQIIWWAMLVSNVIIVSIGLVIYKTGIWEKKVI
jgi:Na+-driven multidrug efflux pump